MKMFKKKIPLVMLVFLIVSVGDPLLTLYNKRMSPVAQDMDSLKPLEFLRDEIMVDVSVENSSGVVQNRKTSFFRNPNNSTLYLEMQPGILAWNFGVEEFVSSFDNVHAAASQLTMPKPCGR